MENNTFELSLLDPEERDLLEFCWKNIPTEDRKGLSKDDVLFVLDAMDDYLEEAGLLEIDDDGEAEYTDGDVDETEQMNYVLEQIRKNKRNITGVQVQLIMDGELQYGINQGYYDEE